MRLMSKLIYKLKDLNEITIKNLINLLKDSQGILKSVKDIIIKEGETNTKCLK